MNRSRRAKGLRRAAMRLLAKGLKEGAEGGYISDGMFIAAGIACGFKAEAIVGSVSSWLNMSVVPRNVG